MLNVKSKKKVGVILLLIMLCAVVVAVVLAVNGGVIGGRPVNEAEANKVLDEIDRLIAQNDTESAKAKWNELRDAGAQSKRFLLVGADVGIATKQYDKAIEVLNYALAAFPDDTEIMTKLDKVNLIQILENATKTDYYRLHQDYMDNPIAADAKYKGEYLILEGEISDINREIAGNPYITFDIDFLENIRVTFRKSEEEKIAELKKGQHISIVGECKGALLTTIVMMGDCLLIG